MTEKKQRIINASIELFSQKSFHGTSTKEIALLAEVSEGLVFKHFKNKYGLLNYMLEINKENRDTLYSQILNEKDPQRSVKKTIEIPLKVAQDEHVIYWQLYYKLKWEMNLHIDENTELLQKHLTISFTKLGYSSPSIEAEHLIYCIEGILMAVLNHRKPDTAKLIQHLKKKYK